MNVKRSGILLLAPLTLAACGQSAQQPSSSPTPAATLAALAGKVRAGSVKPVSASAISSAVLSGQACSLDTIDGNYGAQVTVEKGKPHELRGWLENNHQKPAGKFRIVVNGAQNFAIPAETKIPRPDVAVALKNPALKDSGFNVSVYLDSIPSGDYTVRFLMKADGKTYWCDTKKSVVLE